MDISSIFISVIKKYRVVVDNKGTSNINVWVPSSKK